MRRNCSASSARSGSAPTPSSDSPAATSSRNAGAVLHARGARSRAPARVQPLSLAAERARVPLEPIGPGTSAIAARSSPVTRSTSRGAVRPRLRPRRRATAPRGRRDRHRALPVPLGAPRRRAGAPRLPLGAPRRGGGARAERRGRARPDARHRRAPRRSRRRPRLRARADARRARGARSGAQLAREAPMACGYGACYGCVSSGTGIASASASKDRSSSAPGRLRSEPSRSSTPRAASMRSRRPRWPARSTPS